MKTMQLGHPRAKPSCDGAWPLPTFTPSELGLGLLLPGESTVERPHHKEERGESPARTSREEVEALFPELYAELRGIARKHRRRHGAFSTLSTTAVVNEAYLRMRNSGRIAAKDRSHFLALSSRVMRFVLVDYARRSLAQKRDGVAQAQAAGREMDTSAGHAESMLALDAALERLGAAHARMARVVEARFFAGLSEPEIAKMLSVSERTVRSDWQRARLWLARDLGPWPTP